MTQRPLTADEQADMKSIHDLIGRRREILYAAASTSCVVEMSHATANAYEHATTDGKPLRTERVPTAADIGRRVKCKRFGMHDWEVCHVFVFVGFDRKGRYVVQSAASDTLSFWDCCIIDEEAAQ